MFITIEGPDGAGKSRQAALLADRLRAAGHDVVLTREPGGTDFGERIRALLMNAPVGGHDPLSDALLFNAARAKLIGQVIKPGLARGAVVVCDRYADSTRAYQGYGSGIHPDTLAGLQILSTGGLTPTRTVLIDVSVESGLARRQAGAEAEMTRFEQAESHDAAFHERVRKGFLQMAADEPDRWRVVDGEGDTEEVAERVWKAVADLFES